MPLTKQEKSVVVLRTLKERAAQKCKITYTELHDLTGHPQQGFGLFLDPITVYCKIHDKPNLSVIVVRAGRNGGPGDGYLGPAANIDGETQRVFCHDWTTMPDTAIVDLLTL